MFINCTPAKTLFKWKSNWQMSSSDYRRHQICHSNHPIVSHLGSIHCTIEASIRYHNQEITHLPACERMCATFFTFHHLHLQLPISHASDLIKFRTISAQKTLETKHTNHHHYPPRKLARSINRQWFQLAPVLLSARPSTNERMSLNQGGLRHRHRSFSNHRRTCPLQKSYRSLSSGWQPAAQRSGGQSEIHHSPNKTIHSTPFVIRQNDARCDAAGTI